MGRRKRFLVGVLASVVFAFALGACRQEPVVAEPTPLDFDTDPRILRGIWTGESATGQELQLEVEAHDPDDSGYAVTGIFTLHNADPVAFSGYVRQPLMPSSNTLRLQTSPGLPPLYAESEAGRWTLEGEAPTGSPPRFQMHLFGVEMADTFLMTKEADPLPLPEDADVPVTTDRERYTPEDFGDYVRYTIEASYTNTTGESVYLVPCSVTPPPPSYQLEHFDGGQWQFNYLPTCRTGPGPAPATEVEPNEGFTADLTLDVYTARTPENYGYPLLGTDVTVGVNRFAFDIVASVDEDGVANDDLLPLEQRVSNAFELRAP